MKQHGASILVLSIVLIFMPLPSPVFSGEAICTLKYRNNRLSLRAENVPLESVLAELHKKTGIEYKLKQEDRDGVISLTFQHLPVADALRKILRTWNHLIVHGSDGRVRKVLVAGKKTTTERMSRHEARRTSFNIPVSVSKRNIHDMEDRKTSYQGGMVVAPPSREGMEISLDTPPMEVRPPVAGAMEITDPSHTMVIGPPSKKGMVIEHSAEGMDIGALERPQRSSPDSSPTVKTKAPGTKKAWR